MATGLTEFSGGFATPDVPGGGEADWTRLAGLPPTHPMVGGPDVAGLGQYDVDRGRSRTGAITSLPASEGGGTATWTGSLAGVPGAEIFDDWRDLFNFRGSPMPWLLMFALAALGLMQLAISGRLGPARASVAVG